jgi:hypothetical protein
MSLVYEYIRTFLIRNQSLCCFLTVVTREKVYVRPPSPKDTI